MNFSEHYTTLYRMAVSQIESDQYKQDHLIDSPLDKRFGITLLLRPPKETTYNIQNLLSDLKEINPSQYYYPNSDIHITVMSIISCYDGFSIEKISVPEYVHLVKRSLQGIGKFKISFKGITAAASGVMIQGFPEQETLNSLRNNLRINFKSSDLEQTIDKRYSIQTAHSTVVRFRHKLNEKDNFLKVLQNYRKHDFGSFEVQELELVYNDWYQREENTKLLKKFILK
ncbi:2'-5' RNA ligase family protein [Autumnicola musiva]|uniref:Mutarotase n=1 Tax=Autumnicola musiva TaxID=3075589 RepID=A0ABU3D4Z1_9FLAO|nr:mutarotase [Zunongwangia sp. F117]MDT0676600.1 mutarotase [Zunongwangia sp. F117]